MHFQKNKRGFKKVSPNFDHSWHLSIMITAADSIKIVKYRIKYIHSFIFE